MKFIAFILAAVTVFSFGFMENGKIRIAGTYTVPPKVGEKIYVTILLNAKTKAREYVDSTSVINNRFSFDLNVQPGKYELVNTAGQALPVYLDHGTSLVRIDSNFSRAKISGNTTDSLIKQFEGAGTGMSMMQLGAALMSQKYKKEGKEVPDSLLNQLKDGMMKMSALRKESARSIGLRKDLASAFVLANGAASEFTTAEMNEIYSGLPDYVKAAAYGKSFKTLLDKLNSLAIGVKAPAFAEQSPEGKEVKFAEFVKGKKLVLIDFWASWCGPCRKENPNVVALYNRFKSKGFDIIGVSLDSKKEDWIKAIADDQLTWTHVSDLGGWKASVAQLYNVSAVPHTVLVDGNGVIVAKNLRGKELDAKVEEICK